MGWTLSKTVIIVSTDHLFLFIWCNLHILFPIAAEPSCLYYDRQSLNPFYLLENFFYFLVFRMVL